MTFRQLSPLILIIFFFGCSSADNSTELIANKLQLDLPNHYTLENLEITDEVDNGLTVQRKFNITLVATETLYAHYIDSIRKNRQTILVAKVAFETGERIELTGIASFDTSGNLYGANYIERRPDSLGLSKSALLTANPQNDIYFPNSEELQALIDKLERDELTAKSEKQAEKDAKIAKREAEQQEKERQKLLAEQEKLNAQKGELKAIQEVKQAFHGRLEQIYKANGQVIITTGARRANRDQSQYFNMQRSFKVLRNIRFGESEISGESWDVNTVNAIPFSMTWLEIRDVSRPKFELEFVEKSSPESVIWGNKNVRNKPKVTRLTWSLEKNVAEKSAFEINLDPAIQKIYTNEFNKVLPPWGNHDIRDGNHIIVEEAIYHIDTSQFVGYITDDPHLIDISISQTEKWAFDIIGHGGGAGVVYSSPSANTSTYSKMEQRAYDLEHFKVLAQYRNNAVFFNGGDFFYVEDSTKVNVENFLVHAKRLTDLGVFENPQRNSALWGNYFYFVRTGNKNIVNQIDVRNGALTQLPDDNPLVTSFNSKESVVFKFNNQNGVLSYFDLFEATSTELDSTPFDLVEASSFSQSNVKYRNSLPQKFTRNLFGFLGKDSLIIVDTNKNKVYSTEPSFINSIGHEFEIEPGLINTATNSQARVIRTLPSKRLVLVQANVTAMLARKETPQNRYTNLTTNYKYLTYDLATGKFASDISDVFKEFYQENSSDYNLFGDNSVAFVYDNLLLKMVSKHSDLSKIGLWLHDIKTNKTSKVNIKPAQYCGSPQYFENLNKVFHCYQQADGSQIIASFDLNGNNVNLYPEIPFRELYLPINK